MKEILGIILMVSALTSLNAIGANELKAEKYDDWIVTIAGDSKNGPLLVSAVAFAGDDHTRFQYTCSFNSSTNFRVSTIGLIFEDEIPFSQDNIASINYESDIEAGQFASTDFSSVSPNELGFNNLHLWELIQKSNLLKLNIKVNKTRNDLSSQTVYVNNGITFNFKSFLKAKRAADAKCGFQS